MQKAKNLLLCALAACLANAAHATADYLVHDLNHATDAQLAGKTPAQSIAIYSARNTSTGVYTRNVNLWTTLDLTGTTANNWGGVAISPRHVIYAAHASAGVGAQIHFVTADNVTITRTITAMQTAPGYVPYWPDWRIALLDADLPPTIAPAKFLPDNWTDYLPADHSQARFPTIGLNQFREATVQELSSLDTGGTQPRATTRVPVDPQRYAFYRNKISGDSSSPLLIDLLGQPVVLTVWTFGGSGSGTSLTAQKTAINTVMANLGGGYQLTEADLTAPTATLPLNTDFEAPEGYSLGYFRTSHGFTTTLTANIVPTGFSGTQSLTLTGPGWLNLAPSGWTPGYETTVTWIDFYLKPVAAATDDLPANLATPQAAVTGFVKTGPTTAEVHVIDGDGQGAGQWLGTGYHLATTDDQADAWIRVSYRLDYAAKRWDLYLDGDLVRADLRFADDAANPFTQLRFRGDTDKTAHLDYLYIGSDNPLYTDTTGDGLPDDWLLANGLNPAIAQRYADPDQDGLDNLTEYTLGLSPGSPDTDQDGVFDRRELLWQTDPTTPDPWQLGAVPYADSFETDAPGAFAPGTRLWQITAPPASTATIATTGTPDGTRHLALAGADITLQRHFTDPTHAPVWLDLRLKATPRAEPPDDLPADIAAVFYLAPDGHLMALDGAGNGGGQWIATAIAQPEWNRLTLRLDYPNQRWTLWLNGTRVAENLGFAHPVPYFSGLALRHDSTQAAGLDALHAAHAEPPALDNDGDGLPNTWETTYGLNPDDPADATLSHSNDGWSNLEKYAFGVAPTTNHLSALPLVETFDPLTPGPLAQGTNNWFHQGETAPAVDPTQAHQGAHSLLIPASEDGVRLINHIDGANHPVIWTQFTLKATPSGNNATPELPPGTTAGLFFTQDGHPRVYDGATAAWITLTTHTADLTAWQTITLRHDYTAQTWNFWLNGALVAENLGFAHARSAYHKFELHGAAETPTYLDTLRVQTTSTLVPGGEDPEPISDAWKLRHFGTLAIEPTADPDADGLSNQDEYAQGRIPTIADGADDLYVNNLTGDDTQYNGRSAAPGRPAPGHGPKATLSAALATAVTEGRIIITAEGQDYTETTLPLAGKTLRLRPHGNVRINGQ